MNGQVTLVQLRDAVEAAEERFCEALAQHYPPGSVVTISRGNFTGEATVCAWSDRRLRVENLLTNREYWVGYSNIACWEQAIVADDREQIESEATDGSVDGKRTGR